MKKGLTEMVFILDKSGSMSGLEADTIGGYNSMIEKQKKEEGEALISTVVFDSESRVVCDRVPVQKMEPMTDRDYIPSGCTALLDAIGQSIHHISNIYKYAREEDVPEKTIFVITTDGMENSSRMYDYHEIKDMIKKEESKYGWEFIFLGANIDVAREADRLGIRQDRAVKYRNDSRGIELNFGAVGSLVSRMRCAESTADIDGSWAEEIKEYEKKQ